MRKKIYLLVVFFVIVVFSLVFRFNQCNYYGGWLVYTKMIVKRCTCIGMVIEKPLDYIFGAYDVPSSDYCLGFIQKRY